MIPVPGKSQATRRRRILGLRVLVDEGTAREYAEAAGIDMDRACYDLRALEEAGLVEEVGGVRHSCTEPTLWRATGRSGRAYAAHSPLGSAARALVRLGHDRGCADAMARWGLGCRCDYATRTIDRLEAP